MKIKPLSNSDKALLLQYGIEDDISKAKHFSFKRGEYLSREGEALNYLYFVVSGKAKIMLNLSDGKQLLLANFVSKGIIGDIELMTDVQTYQTTLQAVTDFECIALPLYEYRTTLIRNITFINLVGKELAEKLMQRAINGAINILQPLEARLSAYIMQTAIDDVFDEQLTDVAVMLGTSYRHLLRSLEKLRLSNVLEKRENTYRILNQKALKALSGDLYMFY